MTDITASPQFATAKPARPLTWRGRVRAWTRRAHTVANDQTGAATAEYAIATMAAVAFAGLLVAIMRSDEIKQVLTDLVERALTVP